MNDDFVAPPMSREPLDLRRLLPPLNEHDASLVRQAIEAIYDIANNCSDVDVGECVSHLAEIAKAVLARSRE